MKYPFVCISDLVFADQYIEPVDVILVPGSTRPQVVIKVAGLYKDGFAP